MVVMGGSACFGDQNQLMIPSKSWTTCTCSCVIGRSEFNNNKIIPHYYNNIFLFHMHTFTIFTLIFNTFNFAIH